MKIKLGLGPLTMQRVAEYCGGELIGGAERNTFEYICTDSREADSKTLFIATRGEKVDGHDYIRSAHGLGCVCFLCEYLPEDAQTLDACFCRVENTFDSFSQLARGYRGDNLLDAVAITGSVGKTTTKELTACVLREGFNLYRTEGNFNSIIGMPMSLMEANAACTAAVFEMGMSGFGEIRRMSIAATPKIAMITNIGSSHLEYLGTRENIALAKFEISEGIRQGGVLVLNGDEPLLRRIISEQGKTSYRTLFVSLEGEGDYVARNISFGSESSRFDLYFGDSVIDNIEVPAVGKHIVYDAAFACVAGLLMGLDGEQIRSGLRRYTPGAFRQKIYEENGVKIIADCYNAAPESMRGALEVLANLDAKRKIAVLGDMRELGGATVELHRGVGELAYRCGIDMLFTVGELGRFIAEGAIFAGMSEDCVFCELDTEGDATVQGLKGVIKEGDAVLFKASRAMKFEGIIDRIR